MQIIYEAQMHSINLNTVSCYVYTKSYSWTYRVLYKNFTVFNNKIDHKKMMGVNVFSVLIIAGN